MAAWERGIRGHWTSSQKCSTVCRLLMLLSVDWGVRRDWGGSSEVHGVIGVCACVVLSRARQRLLNVKGLGKPGVSLFSITYKPGR
jgi:hypothetical protein